MSTEIVRHCFGITGREIHHVHTRFDEERPILRTLRPYRDVETSKKAKVKRVGTRAGLSCRPNARS